MGRHWYEDGKFLKKKNTFTDFVAVAEHLIAHKYTSPSKLCIEARAPLLPLQWRQSGFCLFAFLKTELHCKDRQLFRCVLRG